MRNAIRAGTDHDQASPPSSSTAAFPSEYGRHLAFVAQAPAAEDLLDAVRHAVYCTEYDAGSSHAHHVPIWWRQVIEAYRATVPEDAEPAP